MATALLDVNVRSLVVADRQLCLELLRSLYQARHLSSLIHYTWYAMPRTVG